MLAHLALRRAIVEALCPYATPQGLWPTLAEDRVFDSRIDMLDALGLDEVKPTIVIYCEEAKGESGSSTNGAPHQPSVDVVLEIGATVVMRPADGSEGFDLARPESDAVLESTIDALVSQVKYLLVDEPRPAFRRARRRVEKTAASPYRDGENGRKIAVRAYTLTIGVPPNDVEEARAVRDLLPADSDGRRLLADAIAAVEATIALDAAPPPPALAGVDLTLKPRDGTANASPVTAKISTAP